ncbi:GNAT family N-acetyltransferase [Sutcliffiella cohnii]|uniref:GNAT family N-acetyltransferase n=1 Tax=Sutcliffiella cohnii TaxID=33932 RepID=UPI002E2480B7|nr:GNAT family N-acetyltransferase [Sutcliffiella cohnii]
MNKLYFIKDYKNDKKLRKSFNELTTMVFGINFEEWYTLGFWNERYLPFSYVDEGKVVANVSVNVLDFVIDGQKKRALQIGTVMTHPDYRNRGLSANLMNKVLSEYENKYDFMYLFANQTVLNFYPKFGFKSVNEYQYSMNYSPSNVATTGIRKLNGNNVDDLHFIYQFASQRVPVSQTFGTENTQSILIFHCMYVFHQDIYYLEGEDAIVIYKKDKNQIDIFDIITKNDVDIDAILSKICDEETTKIVFHYTPDYQGLHIEREIANGSDVLFVRENDNNHFPLQMKHPVTSQA